MAAMLILNLQPHERQRLDQIVALPHEQVHGCDPLYRLAQELEAQ
ncbi:hypothetical protein NCGM1900_5945 [Pseudomonas aeruginosa]|nr:hypothetical protein NCGM1900_5945 [Pseudomonas aeruginosa]